MKGTGNVWNEKPANGFIPQFFSIKSKKILKKSLAKFFTLVYYIYISNNIGDICDVFGRR